MAGESGNELKKEFVFNYAELRHPYLGELSGLDTPLEQVFTAIAEEVHEQEGYLWEITRFCIEDAGSESRWLASNNNRFRLLEPESLVSLHAYVEENFSEEWKTISVTIESVRSNGNRKPSHSKLERLVQQNVEASAINSYFSPRNKARAEELLGQFFGQSGWEFNANRQFQQQMLLKGLKRIYLETRQQQTSTDTSISLEPVTPDERAFGDNLALTQQEWKDMADNATLSDFLRPDASSLNNWMAQKPIAGVLYAVRLPFSTNVDGDGSLPISRKYEAIDRMKACLGDILRSASRSWRQHARCIRFQVQVFFKSVGIDASNPLPQIRPFYLPISKERAGEIDSMPQSLPRYRKIDLFRSTEDIGRQIGNVLGAHAQGQFPVDSQSSQPSMWKPIEDIEGNETLRDGSNWRLQSFQYFRIIIQKEPYRSHLNAMTAESSNTTAVWGGCLDSNDWKPDAPYFDNVHVQQPVLLSASLSKRLKRKSQTANQLGYDKLCFFRCLAIFLTNHTGHLHDVKPYSEFWSFVKRSKNSDEYGQALLREQLMGQFISKRKAEIETELATFLCNLSASALQADFAGGVSLLQLDDLASYWHMHISVLERQLDSQHAVCTFMTLKSTELSAEENPHGLYMYLDYIPTSNASGHFGLIKQKQGKRLADKMLPMMAGYCGSENADKCPHCGQELSRSSNGSYIYHHILRCRAGEEQKDDEPYYKFRPHQSKQYHRTQYENIVGFQFRHRYILLYDIECILRQEDETSNTLTHVPCGLVTMLWDLKKSEAVLEMRFATMNSAQTCTMSFSEWLCKEQKRICQYVTADVEEQFSNALARAVCDCLPSRNPSKSSAEESNSQHNLECPTRLLLKERSQRLKEILVAGFNSGKYDTILLLADIWRCFRQTFKPEVLLKDNNFLKLQAGLYSFVDVRNLLPPSLSLEEFGEMLGVSDSKKMYFPYEWFDKLEKLGSTTFPPLEHFHKRLTKREAAGVGSGCRNRPLTVDDYNNAKDIFHGLSTEANGHQPTMGQYMLEYCSRDVKILGKALSQYQRSLWDDTNMDILNYVSISGFSEANALRESKVSIPNISTYSIYGLARASLFGGNCQVFRRHCALEDASAAGISSIIGIDLNSCYPYCQSLPVPIGQMQRVAGAENFSRYTLQFIEVGQQQRKLPRSERWSVRLLEKRLPRGGCVEDDPYEFTGFLRIDAYFTELQKKRLERFPPLVERLAVDETLAGQMTQEEQRQSMEESQRAEKLIYTLSPKQNYAIFSEALKFLLEMDMITLDSINEMVQIPLTPAFRPFIDKLAEKRKNASTSSEKDLVKLRMNSLFGRTIFNETKYSKKSKVISTAKEYISSKFPFERLASAHPLSFPQAEDDGAMLLQYHKRSVTIKSPHFLGSSILWYSKILMLHQIYNTLLYNFDEQEFSFQDADKAPKNLTGGNDDEGSKQLPRPTTTIEIIYTDTDSLYFKIDLSPVGFRKRIRSLGLHNYFSLDGWQFGMWKIECSDIKEMIALNPKCYIYRTDSGLTVPHTKGASFQHSLHRDDRERDEETATEWQAFSDALRVSVPCVQVESRFRTVGRVQGIETVKLSKTVVSTHYDKRIWLDGCGVRTRCFGYEDKTSPETKIADILRNWDARNAQQFGKEVPKSSTSLSPSVGGEMVDDTTTTTIQHYVEERLQVNNEALDGYLFGMEQIINAITHCRHMLRKKTTTEAQEKSFESRRNRQVKALLNDKVFGRYVRQALGELRLYFQILSWQEDKPSIRSKAINHQPTSHPLQDILFLSCEEDDVRQKTEELLRSLSPTDLKIMRNFLYQRHSLLIEKPLKLAELFYHTAVRTRLTLFNYGTVWNNDHMISCNYVKKNASKELSSQQQQTIPAAESNAKESLIRDASDFTRNWSPTIVQENSSKRDSSRRRQLANDSLSEDQTDEEMLSSLTIADNDASELSDVKANLLTSFMLANSEDTE